MNIRKSILTSARIDEISDELQKDLEKWQKICEESWNNLIDVLSIWVPRYDQPTWATYATTIPVKVNWEETLWVRWCLAFHKIPCVFKKQTKGMWCSHCWLSYDDKDVQSISSSSQIDAVLKAMHSIKVDLWYIPPIIEILPDWSFINNEEVSLKSQKQIIWYMSSQIEIKQVAIETRTDFLTIEKIRFILSLLRKDQRLEVYVWLESTDDFIINRIIKKWFSFDEFKKRILEISNLLSDEEKSRLSFTTYHFFKPPYINELEAIESANDMAKKIKEFSEIIWISVCVKYEPAVISDWTFQKYLFEQGKYMPPNYYSVAEIIAKAYFEWYLEMIKFWQRDDIDEFHSVASIPKVWAKHLFSPFDYLVYNAVQRFNADKDIWWFCSDMYLAIEMADEFKNWESEIYWWVGNSFLSKLFQEYNWNKEKFYEIYYERINFQKVVWKCLDEVCILNRELINFLTKKWNEWIDEFKRVIYEIFKNAWIKVLQIKNLNFLDVWQIHWAPKLDLIHLDFEWATVEAVMQYEIVIENEAWLPQSIWECIPFSEEKIDLTQYDFIYS